MASIGVAAAGTEGLQTPLLLMSLEGLQAMGMEGMTAAEPGRHILLLHAT